MIRRAQSMHVRRIGGSRSMKCFNCQKGPQQGVTVYRINAKGVPGIWACARHYKQTDAPPIDPDVQAIASALEQAA